MGRPKSPHKRRSRINLDVNYAFRKAWESLRDRTGSASLTETVRRAMALYDLAVTEIEAGSQILIEKPDGELERVVLLFEGESKEAQ